MTKSSRYIRNLNTEDQLSSLEDSLQEYKERLERTASQLELCRSQETWSSTESQALKNIGGPC